ncbi:type II toxin-antitoxin system VapC family toxin [Candidatus Micrarchaeota archaeon]|nr:type II toxin-antitoxin system VapC family toxin [Candidatus Micrarchaeota archaeon]
MMKYIDAGVFVIAAGSAPPTADKALEILRQIAAGKMQAGTSVLSWDELAYVIRKKLGGGNSKDAKEQGRLFLSTPNLKLFNATSKTVSIAQELMEKYDLRPRDAIHAATAMENGITEIVSTDSDFGRIRGIKWIKI